MTASRAQLSFLQLVPASGREGRQNFLPGLMTSMPPWSAGLNIFTIQVGTVRPELRSGYAWKNLAEGGRGVARAAAPGRYWRSISFHLLLAGAINAFNVWMHFQPEQLAR